MSNLLSILAGAGNATSSYFDDREKEKEQQRLADERKRQERMNMLVRFMGQIDDPALKAQFMSKAQSGDVMSAYGDIVSQQAQKQKLAQQQAQQKERQSQQLDDFVTGNVGANTQISDESGRFSEQFTEQDARMLGAQAQQGNGLQALLDMRKGVGQRGQQSQQQAQQSQMSEAMNNIASAKDPDSLKSLRAVYAQQFGENSQPVKIIDQRIAQGFGDESGAGGEVDAPKVTANQQNQLDAINTFDAQSRILEGLLDNPDVASELGPFSGRINRSMQGGFLDAFDPPTEFTVTQGVLANMADAFLRSRTGAAAQDEEVQKVSRDIVGSVQLTAPQIKALTTTLRTMMQLEKEAIQNGEVNEQSLAVAALELANLFRNPPSAKKQGNKSPSSYDPQVQVNNEEIQRVQELRRRGGQ